MVPKKLILLTLLSTFPALANKIMVTGVDSSMGLQQSLWVHEDQNHDGGSNSQIYWAGAIDISVDGYIRQVFCVQLFVDIYLNQTYDTIIDFSDTPNLERLSWLMQNEFPGAPLTGAALRVQGAAFQLAIWDIIEDNGDGFAPGAGKLTQSTDPSHPTDAGVLAAAAKYETDSLGMSSNYGAVYHNSLNGTPMQNLMGIPVTDGGPSPVPEPAAIVLFFSGLALIGLSRLRRDPTR